MTFRNLCAVGLTGALTATMLGAAVPAALADTAAAPTSPDRIDTILVGPGGAEALTLADLRLMAQADLVLHEPGIPAEVLALVRRDAARRVGTEIAEGESGRILLIRLSI